MPPPGIGALRLPNGTSLSRPIAYTITSSSCARFIALLRLTLLLLKFIGLSTPSVKTSTTRRPSWRRSAFMPTLTAFHSGVGPSAWSSVRMIWTSSR